MAEWNPRSITPFSESYTPSTRAHSLAPSTRWRSRSRSRVASSSGSSPPPDEVCSDLDGEYEEEEEEECPHLIHLENLPEPEDRGRRGMPPQEIPKEAFQPPALLTPCSASSQEVVNQASNQGFLSAVFPTIDDQPLPAAAPYFNRLQRDPHHNPFQNIASQMQSPQNPPCQNMANQTRFPNPRDQMFFPVPQAGLLNPSAPLTTMANPTALPNMGHQMNPSIIRQPNPFGFSADELATRLLQPVESSLIWCGYDNPLGDSSQNMPSRKLQAPSQFDKERDLLMFNFLAKLERDLVKAARYRPLLEMNEIAYSQLPTDAHQRAHHINDIDQLVRINRILDTGMVACQSMLQRFSLLRNANTKRVNYTIAYLSITRRLPSDILYQLFDCCVHDAGISPWTLGAVSKQFRGVAMSCPKIWDSIRLDVFWTHRCRYFNGYDVCRTVKELERSLVRSGGRPLTIDIEKCSKEMATHLRCQALGRWANIRYNASKNGVDVERALFGYSMPLTALGLASFEVHQHCDPIRAQQLVQWVKQHKPKRISYLRSCHYIGLSIPQPVPAADQWWSRLQTFEASFPYPGGEDPAIEQKDATIILNILEQTRNTLTELKLKDITMDITADELHLPNLQKLTLIAVKSWWKIVGNRVTEFELWPHDAPPPERLKVAFPKLKTLRYHSGSFAMRGILSAPELELLIYHVGKTEGRFIWESDTWESEDPNDTYTMPGLTPTELHLHGVQVRCAELVRGLQSLSGLEKFHLYSSQVWAGFLRPMAGMTRQKLLPNLTEIMIELPSFKEPSLTRKKYTAIFIGIARERDGCHGMRQLKRFGVKWSPKLEGGTTIFVYTPEQPVSISEWTTVEVLGVNIHSLITRDLERPLQ